MSSQVPSTTMFKKPLTQLKTSAPVRASDRRKLKQHVISTLGASPEDGDLLVPDGILVAKSLNYAKQPITLYLDPNNKNPLWFTVGKESEDLVPTVYTLWKLPNSNLLPIVLTPSAVIPILAGGADLMIPGVITHTPFELAQHQLVAVHQLSSTQNADGNISRIVSLPLAVGRMAVSGEELKAKRNKDEKGKAVLILHSWKDHLWEMGQKGAVPPGAPLSTGNDIGEVDEDNAEYDGQSKGELKEGEPKEGEDTLQGDEGELGAEQPEAIPRFTYTPQEITDLLTKSLIHAIAIRLSNASFPIPSSQFYSTYILPSRPAYPTSVVPPSAAFPQSDSSSEEIHIDPSEITIKSSSHKSLHTFLKAAEKSSLLTLKSIKQKSGGADSVVTSVKTDHPDVEAYATGSKFVTVAAIEEKEAKKVAREEKAEKERERIQKEVDVKQLWKPHLRSASLFEAMGGSGSDLYTLNDIRMLLTTYFTSNQLINQRDQSFINLDPPLLACVSGKPPGEGGKKGPKDGKGHTAERQVVEQGGLGLEFMKRDELVKRVVEQMQNWYEIKAEGHDVVTSKGEIKPIQVGVRIGGPGGRRGVTTTQGFEPFLVIDAEDMAEDLKKICAGSTSVSPYQVPGTSQQRSKVVVQGKQSKSVVDYLLEKGIPKKWIEVNEAINKK